MEDHPVSWERGVVAILFDEPMKLLAPHFFILRFTFHLPLESKNRLVCGSLSPFTFHLLSLFHHVYMFTIKCTEHTLPRSKHADKAVLHKR
jgi:hypothetical protein